MYDEIYYSCESKEYTFNVFSKYSIIFSNDEARGDIRERGVERGRTNEGERNLSWREMLKNNNKIFILLSYRPSQFCIYSL
jgi:hypothetical protein